MKRRILPMLLAGMLALPALAADYYIGEKGNGESVSGGALDIEQKGGWTFATFNLGQNGFSAAGMRRGDRVVLDHFREDGPRPGGKENFGLTLVFSGEQVKVNVDPRVPDSWQNRAVNKRFYQLSYAKQADSMRAEDARFAKAERRMNDAMAELLAASSADGQSAVRRGQAKWMSGIDSRVQTVIMYSALTEYSNVRKNILQGYTAVLNDRAMMLSEMAKQAQNPQYVPSMKGTISFAYCELEDGICFSPRDHYVSIPLCKAGTPACRAAEKLLEGEMEADVKVTGRLEPARGFAPQGLKVKAVR